LALLRHLACDCLGDEEGRPDINRHDVVEIGRRHFEKERRVTCLARSTGEVMEETAF
jgi:hypothetical protein